MVNNNSKINRKIGKSIAKARNESQNLNLHIVINK